MKALKIFGVLVVALFGFALIGSEDRIDELERRQAKQWETVRSKSWEAFHKAIDDDHAKKSENWMDAKERRELLEKGVQAVIRTTMQETVAVMKEQEAKKVKVPKPDIAVNSVAWMGYGGEPNPVRIVKGPSVDRQYLIYMTIKIKEYSGGRTYSKYPYEVPTERTQDVYRLVDESVLYFPENAGK